MRCVATQKIGPPSKARVAQAVRKYALGKPLAPVEPDVLDRIIANGSSKISLTPRPLEPAVPALRKKYPRVKDEERLLRHLYAGSQMDEMLAAGPMQTEYYFDKPVVRLLRELARRRIPGRISIAKGDLRLELARSLPDQSPANS